LPSVDLKERRHRCFPLVTAAHVLNWIGASDDRLSLLDSALNELASNGKDFAFVGMLRSVAEAVLAGNLGAEMAAKYTVSMIRVLPLEHASNAVISSFHRLQPSDSPGVDANIALILLRAALVLMAE